MKHVLVIFLALLAGTLSAQAQVQWNPAPSTILEFKSGVYTEYQIEATQTSSPVLHYELTQAFGPLPPGIQFNANGLLYGSSIGFSATQMQVQAHTSSGLEAAAMYSIVADLPQTKKPKSSSSSSGCATRHGQTAWAVALLLVILLGRRMMSGCCPRAR